MVHTGRYIMILGAGLVVFGVGLWALGKAGFRGLPGDLWYQLDRVTIIVPMATCVVLSVLLTTMYWLWDWMHRG